VINHTDMVFDAIETKGIKACFQDVVTMIGFLEFASQNVDYAVVECNMGGRLDPTNVLEKPEATAITSIAYDHMEYLGSTLEAIASEKAGIIKPGVPCFIGPTVTQDSVFRKAKEMGGNLIQIKKKNFIQANHDIVKKLVEHLGIRVGYDDMLEVLN
jgi:dihydrofolate synthase / folylpolyglutamate synthase